MSKGWDYVERNLSPPFAMKTLKSAASLLAGLITIFVLSIVTDIFLEKYGYLSASEFSRNAPWVIALVLVSRIIYVTLGGFLTAKLAPSHPMRHALIIGSIGVAMNIVGAVMTWAGTPHGFSIALIVLAFVCSWLGGKLAARSTLGTSATEPTVTS